jgi:hypothetical protein
MCCYYSSSLLPVIYHKFCAPDWLFGSRMPSIVGRLYCIVLCVLNIRDCMLYENEYYVIWSTLCEHLCPKCLSWCAQDNLCLHVMVHYTIWEICTWCALTAVALYRQGKGLVDTVWVCWLSAVSREINSLWTAKKSCCLLRGSAECRTKWQHEISW